MPVLLILFLQDMFVQREPFLNSLNLVCRFISLSPLPTAERPSKEKFIYAVSVKPLPAMTEAELEESSQAAGVQKLNPFSGLEEAANLAKAEEQKLDLGK